jgi:hypothetical protein
LPARKYGGSACLGQQACRAPKNHLEIVKRVPPTSLALPSRTALPVTPLPTVPPTAASGPTQTVVVLPPEVVDKIAPETGFTWLNGPTATLIAGLLTLIGAEVAFWAISRQIRANAKAVNDQIKANADAVSRQIEGNQASVASQIEAATAHQRRAERLDVVTEAASLVHDLAALATQHAAYGGNPTWLDEPSEVAQGRVENEFESLIVWPITRRLDLLGMSEAAEAVEAAYFEASRVIKPHMYEQASEEWTIYDKKDQAFSALKRALDLI